MRKLQGLRRLDSGAILMAMTPRAFKAALRQGEFAWPGGYQTAFITYDGEVLCFACARDCAREVLTALRLCSKAFHNSGWSVEAVGVLWEGPDEYCCHCGSAIPTAYGDPDTDSEDSHGVL